LSWNNRNFSVNIIFHFLQRISYSVPVIQCPHIWQSSWFRSVDGGGRRMWIIFVVPSKNVCHIILCALTAHQTTNLRLCKRTWWTAWRFLDHWWCLLFWLFTFHWI
jgi:hypothetical protein